MAFHWTTAQHTLIRELGWALFSEPLLDQLPPHAETAWAPRFDQGAAEILAYLDRDPSPLERHLATFNDKRLGARLEAFWTYFLENHPGYHLYAHNLPIYDNKRTLGALDLLFEDKALGKVIHGEIAIKFYLLFPDARTTDPLQQWIGPNPDDNLFIKLQHLDNHQLPLSSQDTTLEQIRQAGLPRPAMKIAHLKGRLFFPLHSTYPSPSGINPKHLRGRWLRQQDWPSLLQVTGNNQHWQLLDKYHWLLGEPSSTVHSKSRLTSRLGEGAQPLKEPIMLRHLATPGNHDFYMVVPDNWPNH